MGSSLCYALTAIVARSQLRGQHPLCSATGQLSMGAVYALLGALLTGSSFDLSLSGKAWASWAGLIFFGTILAYGIYFTLDRAGRRDVCHDGDVHYPDQWLALGRAWCLVNR